MSADGLTGLLRSFRLPTMAAIWQESVVQAERENWGYRRLLQRLCESEEQDRRERKTRRLLKESGLPDGKTLGNLDEKLLPAKIRRLLPTLLEGHFVDRAENLLAFGLPGRGKTHFLAALGRELILRHRYPVLFTPTFKLVQELLAAKKELRLESQLKRLDRYAVVILGRHRLRAAGSPGDGGLVHLSGRALRAAQRAHQQQSGVLEMGPDFQRPDDHDGGDRPASASRDHPGVQRPERSGPESGRAAKGPGNRPKSPSVPLRPCRLTATRTPFHRRDLPPNLNTDDEMNN